MMKKIVTAVLAMISILNLSLAALAINYDNVRTVTSVSQTPAENIFRMEKSWKNFVLLDSTEEGFLVTSQEYFGTHVFDPDVTAVFDLNDSNNIAYWLNNDFLENGNEGDEIPEQMKKHILEYTWETEDPINDDGDKEVRCKIFLFTATMLKKYDSKFGMADGWDGTSPYRYFFLSSRMDNTVLVGYIEGGTSPGKAANAYGVKPVFWLDKSFFGSERVNLSTLGDNVRKVIIDNNTDQDLKKIYSADEVRKLTGGFAPQAQAVKCIGRPMVGQVLTGSYKYYSPDGKPEKGTTFKWLISDKVNGTYSTIAGENETTYTIRKEDIGKYIKFEVTPQTYTMVGYSVASEARNIAVEEGFAPVAENVRLIGDPYVGSRMILDYNFYDENQDVEGNTKIIFQISKDGKYFKDVQDSRQKELTTVTKGPYSDGRTYISNMYYNYNSGKNYIIQPSDAGGYIRGKVIPVSENYPYSGKTVYTEPMLVYERPAAEVTASEENGSYKADYSFDGKANKEDKTIFGWEYSNTKDGEYRAIAFTKTYNPQDTKGYYRFFAEPQNGIGQKGEKKVSEAFFNESSTEYFDEYAIEKGQTVFIKPEQPGALYSFKVRAHDIRDVQIESIDGLQMLLKEDDGELTIYIFSPGNKIIDVSEGIVKIISGAEELKVTDLRCAGDGKSVKTGFTVIK